MARAGFYIDGYNFYHAVKDLNKPWLKWMCYRALAEQLLRKGHSIEFVKVFTALPTFRPKSLQRHRIFVDAMEASDIQVILGKFKEKDGSCRKCPATWKNHEEKESDVNVAIHLLADSLQGAIDAAYIITTDSDISPACRMIKALKPEVEIITVATPGRAHSYEMLQHCDRKLKVSEQMVSQCLMPQKITREDNSVILRPTGYNPPSP